MKTIRQYTGWSAVALGLVFFTATGAQGQIGGYGDYSNQVQTITTDQTLSPSPYIVGDTGTNNLLEIVGATVGGVIHIGTGVGGGHNHVLIRDDAWLTSGSHIVGVSNSYNRMTVNDSTIDAAAVLNVTVGGSSEATHNRLEMNNSELAIRRLYLGAGGGSYNTATFAEGSKLVTETLNIIGWGAGASHNEVIVTNAGSEWLMKDVGTGGVYVGAYGTTDAHSNRLVATDGGSLVFSNFVHVGIGSGCSYNELVITNDARMMLNSTTLRESLTLGNTAGADHNRFAVSGTGTVVTLTSDFGENRVSIGRVSKHNEMVVSDGALVEFVDPTGANTLYLFASHLAGSSDNLIRIDSGGVVSNRNYAAPELWLAGDGGNNRLEIDGTGSALHNFRVIYVGSGTNFVEVLDGGLLDVTYLDMRTTDNRLDLHGTNSTLVINDYLRVGGNFADASGNVMLVATGAQVLSHGRVDVGYQGGDNRLEIAGDGAVMTVDDLLVVGTQNVGGNSNQLVVADGGKLHVTGNLEVRTATGTWARVTGTGSEMTVGGALEVGPYAASRDARFWVDQGGHVTATGILQVGFNGSGALLEIDGTESRVVAHGDAIVGFATGAVGNELRVQNGGYLETRSDAYIGYNSQPQHHVSNLVTVTGSGSLWTNSGAITLSLNGGTGNQLRIADEGVVHTAFLQVGDNATLELDNGTLSVTGDGHALQVSTGGLLRGTGTIQADLFQQPELLIEGEVAPGFSTGTLTIRDADLTFGEDAVVHMEIAAIDDFDQIVLEKTDPQLDLKLTFNGTLHLSLLGGYEPQLHDSFQLFTADSYLDIEEMLINDNEAGLSDPAWSWQINNDGSVSVIPEAATTGTMLLGLAFIFVCRRRRCGFKTWVTQ